MYDVVVVATSIPLTSGTFVVASNNIHSSSHFVMILLSVKSVTAYELFTILLLAIASHSINHIS